MNEEKPPVDTLPGALTGRGRHDLSTDGHPTWHADLSRRGFLRVLGAATLTACHGALGAADIVALANGTMGQAARTDNGQRAIDFDMPAMDATAIR